MLPFYSFTFIVLLGCAILFYRIGEFEGGSGWLWAAGSILVSVVVWRGSGGSWLAMVGGQAALFLGITAFRVWRKK